MNVLEHGARRAIISLLRTRELSAGELARALERQRPGLSHHLATLLDARLVRYRAVGSHRIYRLNVDEVFAALDARLEAASAETVT
jgi:DNA-binding transcriptional ArsR family regulator